MWSAVVGAGAKVLGFLTSIANNLVQYAAVVLAAHYGASKRSARNKEEAIEILKEQRAIAGRRDLHRSELLARMRRRKRD